MASRIEDYGLIGDTKGSGLVSKSCDIDWLCMPRFDSEACLAAILGRDEHGRWAIRPTQAVRKRTQRYRGETMILETDAECDGGAVRVIDFMPMDPDRSDVVRIVEGLEGEVPLEMTLDARFGYGACLPWTVMRDGAVSMKAGPDALHLRSSIPVTTTSKTVSALFTIKKGQQVTFVASWAPASHRAPPPLDAKKALARTEEFWKEWASRCTFQGKWRDAVVRSLLTLKALEYSPTGGQVAAPTASLPEEIGGVRNWDYRYCWIRDATLALDAFMIGGYVDEARAWRDWIARAAAGDPSRLQIMYGLAGERRLTEVVLDWLPGYEESRPVHIGNGAWDQFQLDVFGEIFSCFYAAQKMGVPSDKDVWEPMRGAVRQLERVWQRPDEGIWEVRGGGLRHFTHSKVMAWVAFDRVIRLVQEFYPDDELSRTLPHLKALRERIHEEILGLAWNEGIGSFTQSYGTDALDASVLVMPHVGFIDPKDPRMISTVDAIQKNLTRDGFVRRYRTGLGLDGLPGDESPFLACSFWLADNLAFQGKLAEATEFFERLLALKNHLGLLAEEYDPIGRRHIGNFPQAFSHLTLIQTAYIIEHKGVNRLPAAPFNAQVAEIKAA
jgi:GH15 family glucan-1,4-alpha-glucosidase